MKRIEKEFNALTGEETITEREETAAEKKERELFIAKQAELKAEAEAMAGGAPKPKRGRQKKVKAADAA